MIKVELPVPMYLDTQLRELAPKLFRTFEELELLMNGLTVLVAHRIPNESGEDKWKVGFTQSMIVDEQNVAHLAYDPSALGNQGAIYTGAEAVRFLCKQAGIDAPPFTEITVPSTVLTECHPNIWYDICLLVRRVENRVNRVKKMQELSAPELIMFNEQRMLYEAVCTLEHNNMYWKNRHSLCHDNGEELRCLNTVGYSLVYGWERKPSPEERLLRAIFSEPLGLHGFRAEQ